jgi:hypothetical protein
MSKGEGQCGSGEYISKLKSKPFKALLTIMIEKYGGYRGAEAKTGVKLAQISMLMKNGRCTLATAKRIMKHHNLTKVNK